MTRVELQLPEGIVVKGGLYSPTEPRHLVQDMLEIDLPSGITIDVGWYPECDPSGAFKVVVFRDFWRNQLRDPFETKSITEVAAEVQRLTYEYSSLTITVTSSGSISQRIEPIAQTEGRYLVHGTLAA